jgi:hypothetical protein
MKLLLILMTLASLASARSDTVLKDLITAGVWTYDNGRVANGKSAKEFTFHPSGILNIDVEGSAELKWDIKNGVLYEFEAPENEGNKSGGYSYDYTILFLTKHELLLQDTKDKTYTLMYR